MLSGKRTHPKCMILIDKLKEVNMQKSQNTIFSILVYVNADWKYLNDYRSDSFPSEIGINVCSRSIYYKCKNTTVFWWMKILL